MVLDMLTAVGTDMRGGFRRLRRGWRVNAVAVATFVASVAGRGNP